MLKLAEIKFLPENNSVSIRDELRHGRDDFVAIESAGAAINYLGAKAELELSATQFDKISFDGTDTQEGIKDAEVISRVYNALTSLGSFAIEKARAIEAQARELGISLSLYDNGYKKYEVKEERSSKESGARTSVIDETTVPIVEDKSETLPPEHYALKSIIIPDELNELPEAEEKPEVVIGVIDGHTIALGQQTLQLNDLQVDILNAFLEKASRSEWLSTAVMIDEYGIDADRSTRSASRQAIGLAREEIADFIRKALPSEREDAGTFFLAKGDRASKEYKINPKYTLKDLKKN